MHLCHLLRWRNFSGKNPASQRPKALIAKDICLRVWPALTGFLALCFVASSASAADPAAQFHKEIQPLLTKYCSDCHMDGMKKGEVAFDELGSDKELVERRELWFKVLQNVRAGLMPPGRTPAART